jgi:hypothetical protein
VHLPASTMTTQVTDEQLDRFAKRFHTNIARPRDRRHHDWPARLRQWCLRDFPPRRLQGERDRAELSNEHWTAHIRGWVDKTEEVRPGASEGLR